MTFVTRSHDGVEQHTLGIGTRQERVADCPQRVGAADVVAGTRTRSPGQSGFGNWTCQSNPPRNAHSFPARSRTRGRRGTIVTMTTDSLRNVKDRFSEFVDRVDREHERVVVTRNGRPVAVLISPDDLDSLEETLELLSDHTAVKELVEAEAAVANGDVVRGVDAARALRLSPAP